MTDVRIVRKGDGEHFGNAPWTFKATGHDTGGKFDFMVGPVAYMTGPPLHVHHEHHDTFYVLQGVLTVEAGDEVHELAAGDFVVVPPGVPHTFDNLQEDQSPVLAINVMAPAGFNELFAAAAKQLSDEERAELSRRFGSNVGGTLPEKLGLK